MPEASAVASLRLHGTPGLLLPDRREIHLERKHAALLAYLWLEGPTPRARLAGLLWPEASEERARANLRQRLLKLRQEAGDLVETVQGSLRLAAGIRVEPPDPPAARLLDGHAFEDCDALSRWLEARRDAEREERKRQWLARVREAARTMRLDDALYAADQLLQADQESEETYRVLMEVFYLRGDHAAAISAWDRCRHMLRELYGVQPSAATRTLGQTILEAARGGDGHADGLARDLPVATLRPPRLVARDGAMAALKEGWARGEIVCVSGQAGLGKTRLLTDFMAMAGACAYAAARPGDEVLPYATLSRLVLAAADRFELQPDPADVTLAALLLPRLAALLHADRRAAEREHHPGEIRNEFDRTQALLATARLLGACVRLGCRALVVDDLQYADAASVEAFRVLAEPPSAVEGIGARPASTPLRFVFATRPEETSAEASALWASLGATGRLRRVELSPLSESEAVEVMTSLGLREPDVPALASQVWRRVGGNPSFMLETVKLLLSSNGSGSAGGAALSGPLPSSIALVIQRRLELLTPRALHLVQLAAIAGADYSVALAASALACPVIELSAPLRELELRQVFYGRAFVHDLIGSAVLQGIPLLVAEFMHRFVAEHLEQQQGEPASRAQHWRACSEWRRAGANYAAAAELAARAARFREWGEFLDRAIECYERDPAAADDLFAVLLQRAEAAEARAQPALTAAQVERLNGLARSPVQRLQALATWIGWHTDAARTEVALEGVYAGIAEALALRRPDLALQLAQPLGWQLSMRGRLDEALEVLNAHQPWVLSEADLRTRAVFHRTRAAAYGFCDRLQDGIEEGRRALQALQASGDWSAMLPAMSNLGLTHFWRGEFEDARRVLGEARDVRERLHAGGAAMMIDVHLGAVLRDLGEHDAARALLEPMHEALRARGDDPDSRTERVIVENHLAEAWIARGDLQRAKVLLGSDVEGIGIRFRARRLALRLRVQRLDGGATAPIEDVIRPLLPDIDSAFARVLAELELAKLLDPEAALAEHARLYQHPTATQRPGLQLHAAAHAAKAAREAGDTAAERLWAAEASRLQQRCHAYDLPFGEVERLLRWRAKASPRRASGRG